jgi:hypothetical protein
MPVVMSAAGQDPALLRLRVRALDPCLVVVHVDRDLDAGDFRRALSGCDNVEWVPDSSREVVHPAGFSGTRAMFAMLETAVEMAAADDYICAVDAHDYPVVRLDAWTNALREKRVEYIRYYRVARYPWTNAPEVSSWHAHDVRWPARPRRIGHRTLRMDAETALRRTELIHGRWSRRPLAPDSPLARGDASWALSRDAAAHVLDRRTAPRDRFMRRTANSVNMYVHTLIATSPYHARTPAGGYETPECGHDGYVPTMADIPVYGPVPVPTIDDLPRLRTARYPFVRGVALPRSMDLLERLRADQSGR